MSSIISRQYDNTRIIIFCLFLQSCATPGSIDFTVTDVYGNSINNANVNVVSGYKSFKLDAWGSPGKYNRVTDKTGVTDELGKYTFFGLVSKSTYAVASKTGYYPTSVRLNDNQDTNIPLRKIINPTIMLTKHLFKNLPSSEGTYGFDVMEGDLIQPHGSGKYADFQIHVWNFNTTFNGKVTKRLAGSLSATNKNDGFIEHNTYRAANPSSKFNDMYNAPETGYVQSIKFAKELSANNNNLLSNIWYWTDNYKVRRPDVIYKSYFFKIRSDSSNGPLFGKITSPIRFGDRNSNSPYFNFDYFVNPNGTRYLEPYTY